MRHIGTTCHSELLLSYTVHYCYSVRSVFGISMGRVWCVHFLCVHIFQLFLVNGNCKYGWRFWQYTQHPRRTRVRDISQNYAPRFISTNRAFTIQKECERYSHLRDIYDSYNFCTTFLSHEISSPQLTFFQYYVMPCFKQTPSWKRDEMYRSLEMSFSPPLIRRLARLVTRAIAQ